MANYLSLRSDFVQQINTEHGGKNCGSLWPTPIPLQFPRTEPGYYGVDELG